MDLIERKAVVDTINLYFAVTFDALEQSDETYDLKIFNLLTHLKNGLITAIETMPSAHPTQTNTPNALKALDCVGRRAAIDAVRSYYDECDTSDKSIEERIEELPSAQPENCEYCRNLNKTMLLIPQPERLTDDDFETIRIHLSAYKERLCNQRRWKEAEEYQRIIDRFMSFASAQPEPQWIPVGERLPEKSGRYLVTNTQWGAYHVDWNIYYVNGEGHCDGWLWEQGCTAWMPLPEPWRGEEHETD